MIYIHRFIVCFLFVFSMLVIAQDEARVELTIDEKRENKIKALLELVKINKDIYVSEDRVRLEKFINLRVIASKFMC